MRYFKCINNIGIGAYKDIKLNRIYEVYNDGTGLTDETGFIWSKRTVLRTESLPTFYSYSYSEVKFEEVSRGDYLLQKFFDGKIGISFSRNSNYRNSPCSKLSENMIKMVKEKNLRTDQSFCGGGIYYVMDGEVLYVSHEKHIKASLDEGIMDLNDSFFEIEKEEGEEKMENFELSDIKDGMIVETKSEGFAILLNERLFFEDGNIDFYQYEKDFQRRGCFSGEIQPGFEIIAVYKVGANVTEFGDILDDEEDLDLVWKKEESKDKKTYGLEGYGIYVEPEWSTYYNGDINNPILICDADSDSISISHTQAAELVEYLTDILNNARTSRDGEGKDADEDDDEAWDW